MTTRAQAARANENVAPTGLQQKSSSSNGTSSTSGVIKALKPRTRGVRQALGDISNRLKGGRQNDDGAVKKKIRTNGQVLEVPEEVANTNVTMKEDTKTNKAEVKESQRMSLTTSLSKVKLDDEDLTAMDTSLEDSALEAAMGDVDAPHKHNPMMVTEYITDIMAYFRKVEGRRAPSPQYMSKQTDINAKMREILIDWLVEVHLKFKLRLETLYLTTNLIDRFLERRAVKRTKLQLVGCTAMLLASKYEEIYAPEVRDFVYISDKAYTHDQILAMESIMLNTLKFNMTVPSSLRFTQRFLKVVNSDTTFDFLVMYILESHLQKYQFLSFLPSMVAASAAYIAMKSLNVGSWDSKMVKHTTYTADQLERCVHALLSVVTVKSPRYCAVRKKYASPKFNSVSKLKIYTPPGFTPTSM